MERLGFALALIALTGLSTPAAAQEGSVIIPSQMKLNDEQKADLQSKVEKHVVKALKKCVATFPRPEFFTAVTIEYSLRKSGDLRGGAVGGAAPDPNLYFKSDEERDQKDKEGGLARLTLRNDRDLERCLSKATSGFDTGFDRYSAKVTADFAVTWEGKTPKLEATTFEVTKD